MGHYDTATHEPEPKSKKRKPVALIILVIWTILCIIWAITGVNAADCANVQGEEFLSQEDAQTACEAGAGIGIGLIFVVWAVIVFIIAAITLIVRLGRR